MAQAPAEIQEQARRTRQAAKRLQGAARSATREAARLEEMLSDNGFDIAVEVVHTPTARKGEGDS